MKKRIVCFLLTLIMLVSLAPVSAVTASAASLKTSEAAITVLKKLTRYESVCYQVEGTQEFRIGYGTICTGKGHKVDPSTGAPTAESETHTLKGEYEADAALREALKDFDKKVNAFASSNGLTLAQNQHDALVIFSYGFGTAWMDGSGVLKTAAGRGPRHSQGQGQAGSAHRLPGPPQLPPPAVQRHRAVRPLRQGGQLPPGGGRCHRHPGRHGGNGKGKGRS